LHGAFGSADGGTGNDLLVAGPRGSFLDGEEGHDRLVGSPHEDDLDGGEGKDTIRAGGGNDDIDSLDGKKERIVCGSGKKDRALVDLSDRIKGCERGRRIRRGTRHHPPRVIPLAAMLP
jgi:RTX calcium-binding nonapeptide repeat (4 copies)